MNTKTASALKLETEQDLDALKSDLTELRADLKKTLSDARELVTDSAQIGAIKGKELAGKTGEQLTEAKDVVEDRIRAHPLTAIALAFGAGLMIALARRT